jgi:YD repeat-containing protein
VLLHREQENFFRLAFCALALFISLFAPQANSAQERYDYDALGRLIRVIDEQGRVTEYVYDAAGNILQVIAGTGSAQAPTISSISPNAIRRGETKAIQITGTGLSGVQVTIPDPGLDVSNLISSAVQVTFNLTATASALLGAQQITLSNAAGSATTSITVSGVLPTLGMSPLPIAVPPTGSARNFFVSLSIPDNVDHVINVASANTAIATVSPPSVTISAGQTEVIVSIAGQTAGTTAINLTSATIAGTSVPVFVTAEFTGLTTSFAKPLGVVLEGTPSGTSTSFGPFVSPLIGVVVGAYLDNVAPKTFAIGTGPTSLVISGAGLEGVTAVNIQPADGLTLGAISVAPDGRSVTVPVTVAANAATTVRKVVLMGAQTYLPARADADQIRITLPPPEIFSIDPIFTIIGTTSATLTVRGRNLQAAQSVSFTPGTGMSVSNTPVVNADGTILTIVYSVNPLAQAGDHVVTIITPGGSSGTTATSANTFHVVNEVQALYTPIASPLLGVVLQDGTAPPPQTLNAFSSHVGIAFGPVATGISPTVGIIGQSVNLTISGYELGGVTAVQFVPPDGVTLSTSSVSPDGRMVNVTATIAFDAPQSVRTVRLLAGSTSVQFANSNAALFRVSAPLPEFDWISPVVLQVGAPAVTLTIMGRNFQNATLVRVDPPAGITVSPPTVNTQGTQATFTISAAAGSATGPRAVILAVPAGESPSALSAANTLTLVTTIVGNVTPVVSPNVGVVLQDGSTPPASSIGPVVSPALGVVLQDPNPPPPPQDTVRALNLGIAVGPFASGIQVPPLNPNSTGTLVISGVGLADATTVQVVPATGIAVGSLTIAPDGSQVSAPLTLTGAAVGLYGVRVQRGAEQVPFIPPTGTNTFRVGVGMPSIESITPIFASRGETVTMTIRGQNFQGVTAVTATPGTGLFIDNAPTANAAGTEVTVRIGIASDAPEGGRLIHVITPAGTSTAFDPAANTFTVFP